MSDSAVTEKGSLPSLEDWEILMTDGTELVHRQINPKFYDQGVISEQAFRAREDEDRKLSMTRGKKVTAREAREYFTRRLELRSAGSAELSVAEVVSEGSRCVDDSADLSNELPPGHCYVDFRGFHSKGRKALREALAEIATERGLRD